MSNLDVDYYLKTVDFIPIVFDNLFKKDIKKYYLSELYNEKNIMLSLKLINFNRSLKQFQ